MNQINFPKYTREENLACKLSDEQITEARERRKTGESYPSIAQDFKVTPQAIFYWCLSDYERKKRTRERQQLERRNEFDYRKYRERKKKLHPELVEYEVKSTLRYMKQNPKANQVREKASQKYFSQHKYEIYERNRKWRERNREYLRQMAKYYRGQLKERPTKTI